MEILKLVMKEEELGGEENEDLQSSDNSASEVEVSGGEEQDLAALVAESEQVDDGGGLARESGDSKERDVPPVLTSSTGDTAGVCDRDVSTCAASGSGSDKDISRSLAGERKDLGSSKSSDEEEEELFATSQ